MNVWKITTQKIGTCFAAVVRRVDRSEPYLLKTRGKPELFPTEDKAKLAGHEHLVELWNTEPRFEMKQGPVPGAIALEEQTFGVVTSRKGKKATVKRRDRRRIAKQKAIAQAELAGQGKVLS